MRWLLYLSAPLVAVMLVMPWATRADDEKKPVGIPKRVLWTASKVLGSPEPPNPYRIEPAFPRLPKFAEPLDLASTPGVDRLFVTERRGKIFSFPARANADRADLLIDLGMTCYGFALHPKFSDNGYVYVTTVLDPDKVDPKGTRVVRLTVDRKTWKADPRSEKRIIEWPSTGHNGGCLMFGPDGFLYIGTGDGSGIADELQTGQDLTDLLGSILRIDVDKEDAGKGYAIPRDNPFVKLKGARPEIYSYGHRQPWKFSFDRQTGELWAGEVGQDLWEMVYKIEKGGNYGWSVMEGQYPFRPERKKGPTPILKPVIEQHHSLFRSLTGGFVYHGKRLPELKGHYIYGDYDTGKVWGFRHADGKVSDHRELVDTTIRLIDFAEDGAGELYLLDFMGGAIHQLQPAPKQAPTADFPRRLSDTGLFASTKDLKPAPGLIPYSVNAQLWSDGAIKERYLAIPGAGQIQYNAIEYPQPAPGAPRGWKFPDGTVLVKTFFLDPEPGNPASRRRLETRLLHFEQLHGNEEVGDQYWRGYTYIWNDEQTDALLAEPAGVDRVFTIKDAKAPGGKREQKWHFPSRAECTMCHTQSAKFVLGVNTLQMNKDHDYGGVAANQLRTLEHLGLFTQPLPAPPEKLPRLHDADDPKVDINLRARAYLQANCAHCHMKWGGGNADFQLLATLDLKDMGIVNVKPGHGSFDLPDARLLVPGQPDKSLIHHRMTRLGLGRMPHIASLLVDEKGEKLIGEWIKQLK